MARFLVTALALLVLTVQGDLVNPKLKDTGAVRPPHGLRREEEREPLPVEEILARLRRRGPMNYNTLAGPGRLGEALQSLVGQEEAVVREARRVMLAVGVAPRRTAELTAGIDTALRTYNTVPCRACELLVSYLKPLSQTPWFLLGPTLTAACNQLMDAARDWRAREICPGTVDLQLKTLMEVLKRENVTVRDACESINLCWPPDTRQRHHTPSGASGTKGKVAARNSGRATTIRVAQVTDIHIQTQYSEDSLVDCGLTVCCKEKHTCGPESKARKYGEYECNTPQITIDLLLDFIAAENPDIVLYTGDSPPHTMWEETVTSQSNCSKITADAFASKLPGHKVFPCVGNHDFFPTNLQSLENIDDTYAHSQTILDNFVKSWSPVAHFGAAQNSTLMAGGYYTMDSGLPNLKIIAFNTITDLYSFNWYAVLNENHQGNIDMKQAIRDSLQAAKDDGDKVIVLFHHPVGGADNIVRTSRWWESLTREFSDVIVLQVAGHTHNDEFHLLRDGDAASGIMYIAPSLTPKGHINPSVRIYELDATDYTLIDYKQHFIDLSTTGGIPNRPPVVSLLYSAKEEYELPDLSPASWLAFFDRCENNRTLFDKLNQHYFADSYTVEELACDDGCREDVLCGMKHGNFDEVYQCRRPLNLPPTPGENTSPRPTTILVGLPSSARAQSGSIWLVGLALLCLIVKRS